MMQGSPQESHLIEFLDSGIELSVLKGIDQQRLRDRIGETTDELLPLVEEETPVRQELAEKLVGLFRALLLVTDALGETPSTVLDEYGRYRTLLMNILGLSPDAISLCFATHDQWKRIEAYLVKMEMPDTDREKEEEPEDRGASDRGQEEARRAGQNKVPDLVHARISKSAADRVRTAALEKPRASVAWAAHFGILDEADLIELNGPVPESLESGDLP